MALGSKKKGSSKGGKASSKSSAKGSQAKGKGDYDDTNRGVLFLNDKDGNDARPDYTGKINVDGVTKRLAAWIKPNDNVGDFLSISVSDYQDE